MLDIIQNLDSSILLFVQEHLRFETLTGVLNFITNLGDSGFIWILLGIVLLFFNKTRRGGVDVLLCLLLAFVLNDLVLKPLIARVRPYEVIEALKLLADEESSFSFPSGHTNASFAAAYAMTRAFGKKGTWAYVLAALIAFSRIYLGVHYPSDVLGGIVVGTLSAIFAYWLSSKLIKTDFKIKSRS